MKDLRTLLRTVDFPHIGDFAPVFYAQTDHN